MNAMQVIIVLIVAGMVWTGFWLWILLAPRQTPDRGPGGPGLLPIRRALLPVIAVVLIVGFIISLRGLPYPPTRESSLGPPQLSVSVTAVQWAWILSQNTVPAGVPIEFVVTSIDVNHGFAIYNADNQLVTQVQAMPGYTNRLIYAFDHPGTYTIRCLEYCGVPHFTMRSTLTVR